MLTGHFRPTLFRSYVLLPPSDLSLPSCVSGGHSHDCFCHTNVTPLEFLKEDSFKLCTFKINLCAYFTLFDLPLNVVIFSQILVCYTLTILFIPKGCMFISMTNLCGNSFFVIVTPLMVIMLPKRAIDSNQNPRTRHQKLSSSCWSGQNK